MIRKYLFVLMLTMLPFTTVLAADQEQARLNIKISSSIKENKYFLCLYGIGCLSIKAGDHGKVFPIAPIDMNNIQKVAVANVANREMHLQPNDPSCQVAVRRNQAVTITGQLVVKNNVAQINNLHCLVV